MKHFTLIYIQGGSYFVNRFTALRFTAIGTPPAARRLHISPTNQYARWLITFVIREVISFVDRLKALCFTASSAVNAGEFVYGLSAVGGSYQLHQPFVLS
jgi:hypothetical protein